MTSDTRISPPTESIIAIDMKRTVMVRELELSVGPIAQVDNTTGQQSSFIGGLFALKVQRLEAGPDSEPEPLSLVVTGSVLLALSKTLNEYGPSLVGTMLMRHELGATLHTDLGDIPLNVPGTHVRHVPADPNCVMHEDQEEPQGDQPDAEDAARFVLKDNIDQE